MSDDLDELRTELRSLAEGQRRLDAAVRDEVRELTAAVRRAQHGTADAIETTAAEQRRVDALEAALADADRRLAEVRSSESYRIGNAVARLMRAPTRLARRLVRRVAPRARRLAEGANRTLETDPRARAVVARIGEQRVAAVRNASPVRRLLGTSSPGLRSRRHEPVAEPDRLVGLSVRLDGPIAASLTTEDLDPAPDDGPAVTVTDGPVSEGDGARPLQIALGHLTGPPPVAVRLWNPSGFGPDHDGTIARIRHGSDGDEVSSDPPRGPDIPPGRRVVDVDVDSLDTHPAVWRGAFAGRLGVVSVADTAASPWRRAAAIVRAVALGAPVALHDPDPALDVALGADLTGLLREVDLGALTDPLERERLSHRLRTSVLRQADSRTFWRRALERTGAPWPLRDPSVSVLVASNRPALVEAWSALVARQDHPDLEVVACLHGEGFGTAHESMLRERLGDRVTICRVADPTATLGDVLNAGLARASGDLVTKWDDDDLYSSRHVSDVTTALTYSGADLVGKAAEFVYLGSEDVTVRRFSGVMERGSRTLGGMTLTMRRADLDEIGGWRRVPRRVDTRLIDAVVRAGGRTYRTAGFGLVVVRAPDAEHGHTWNPAAAEFLDRSREQWRGLALHAAGVDLAPDEIPTWLT